MISVGINGFGRIGRLVLRASLEKTDSNIKVVAINDIGNINQNAHLFKYDSVHGKINKNIEVEENTMSINGNKVSFYANKSPEQIPWDECGVDIGPKTIELITEAILESNSLLWNGPVGIFEINEYAKGSLSIAEAIAKSDTNSIIGGGDTISALMKSGLEKHVTHICTGGGASLSYLEGKTLPALKALEN